MARRTPLFDAHRALNARLAEFAGWEPLVQAVLEQVTTCFGWGLYDREPLPRWSRGRLTLLGDAEPPAAIHCAGGRDRTGIACGMALWLARAEPEAIAADHALSDENWAPFNEAWLAEAPDAAERERRWRVSQPAGRTLVDVLEEIEQREGIRSLLLGAGADEASLDRLVARLRGEA